MLEQACGKITPPDSLIPLLGVNKTSFSTNTDVPNCVLSNGSTEILLLSIASCPSGALDNPNYDKAIDGESPEPHSSCVWLQSALSWRDSWYWDVSLYESCGRFFRTRWNFSNSDTHLSVNTLSEMWWFCSSLKRQYVGRYIACLLIITEGPLLLPRMFENASVA